MCLELIDKRIPLAYVILLSFHTNNSLRWRSCASLLSRTAVRHKHSHIYTKPQAVSEGLHRRSS